MQPYPVPSDDQTPYPVDFARLMGLLDDMNYPCEVVVKDRAAGAILDGVLFHFSIDSSQRFLSIRAIWDTGIPYEPSWHVIFAAADSWNREMYFPTVYSISSDSSELEVLADFVVEIDHGVSKDQLTHSITTGVSTCVEAIEYMKEAATQTLGWTNPRAH